MREIDPVDIVVLLACFGISCVIVGYWRHIVYLLVQCLSLLIACGGILFIMLGAMRPEIPWVHALDVPMDFLGSLPRAVGTLVGTIFIFSGIPLMILFRAICLRLMPWLEIFSFPPAVRDAYLATGVQPVRDVRPLLPPRLLKLLACGGLGCTAIFGPLVALSMHGVELASHTLEVVSHIALVLLCLGVALLGGRGYR